MKLPAILAEITFLTPEQGGRSSGIGGGWYRPHLVVLGDGPETVPTRRGADDEYLGVVFDQISDVYTPGEPALYLLVLLYFPEVNYEALVIGAKFAVREGAKSVAYGTVILRED
jgi:hypothetical protein